MILNAYALLDTKAGFFSSPFFCQSHGEAIRICIDTASDMRTTVARYPNDFHLYFIGQYDNQSGFFKSEHPESLGVISGMLPTQQPLPLEQHAQLAPTNLNGATSHAG